MRRWRSFSRPTRSHHGRSGTLKARFWYPGDHRLDPNRLVVVNRRCTAVAEPASYRLWQRLVFVAAEGDSNGVRVARSRAVVVFGDTHLRRILIECRRRKRVACTPPCHTDERERRLARRPLPIDRLIAAVDVVRRR